jgi:methyl-accepting chemotaxis protein
MPKYRNIQIGIKFAISMTIMILAAFFSIFGMTEIAKTTHLQKIERDHIELATLLESRCKEYIDLLRNGTPMAVAQANKMLNAKSGSIDEMGIKQLVDKCREKPVAVFEDTNFLEKILFKWFGFAAAFDCASKAINDCNKFKEILENGPENDIGDQNEYVKQVLHYAKEIKENGREFAPIIHKASLFVRNLMIPSSVILLALALFTMFVLAKGIIWPLKDATVLAQAVADGDLTQKIEIDRTDEIGIMIQALNQICDKMGKSLTQASATSRVVADGASNQASSIEHTTASLENISSMVKKNADRAREADTLMKEANLVVKRASGFMEELTSSMEEISKASKETSKIIKTIDEIAFQTNLLALNAAVEAARAGEAGTGFAVVADEVRNLAMKSANAARNTTDMIDGTVKKIETGAGIVSSTNETFSEMAESATKVAHIISEMSTASLEQSQGIEHLNSAMAEIDKVVQQNAASAEELASIMATFRVRKTTMTPQTGTAKEE